MITKKFIAPVLTLCSVQVLSSALVTYIFPFVAAYILSMGVDEREVSIYAGWADSAISVADVLFLPIHVRIIPYFPHRSLFVFTLLFSGMVVAIAGFCTSPWQLVALRGLMGFVHFSGFMTAIALGEVVDAESRNEAFSWLAAGNAIGSMVGSTIGGYLSEPDGVPVFSGLELFRVKPYAAPGIFLMFMTILASLAVLLVVKETNPRYCTHVPDVVLDPETIRATRAVVPKKGVLTTKMLLGSRRFQFVSLAELSTRACVFGCLALLSTAGKLSPTIGGLGLEITEIARVLFITPLLTLVNLLVLFPWLSKHNCHSDGLRSWEGVIYLLWYFGQAGGMIWWTLKSILLLNLYPHPDDRTLATGVIRLATNTGIIIGAAGSTRLFSISSGYEAGSLGRQMVWIWLGGLAFINLGVGLVQPSMEEPDSVLKAASAVVINEETPLFNDEGEGGRTEDVHYRG